MSALVDVRDAIVTALAAAPELTARHVRVYTHGGAFGLKDLERYSREAPCLIVALLSFVPTLQAGAVMTEAVWGVIALTKDEPGASAQRDRAVIAVLDSTVRVLMRLFPSAAATASAPHNAAARNMFSTALDAIGIAMWGFEFKQTIELVDDTSSAVDLETLHADWNAPA